MSTPASTPTKPAATTGNYAPRPTSPWRPTLASSTRPATASNAACAAKPSSPPAPSSKTTASKLISPELTTRSWTPKSDSTSTQVESRGSLFTWPRSRKMLTREARKHADYWQRTKQLHPAILEADTTKPDDMHGSVVRISQVWWAQLDLNQRPLPYQGSALTV